MALFPSPEWFDELKVKLNSDERYRQIASNWEGDMRFVIEANGALKETMYAYIDLWHGSCREVHIETEQESKKPAFILKAPYENFARVVKGDLDPMQALMTRKLSLTGNMAVLMRSVPTVLDFVRCCREVTSATL